MPTAGSASTPPPVTVSITRSVDPDRVPEVTHWVQTGVNLANTWPGFLGSGWVRSTASSTEWHMLYRFANASLLEAWETSTQRAEWLEGGHGLVEERRVNRRTGIEGWFDAPTNTMALDIVAGAPTVDLAPTRPPRWKQATSIWLGFFPVNLVFTLLVTTFVPGWSDLPTAVKVLVTTSILTPLMAYWVLPFVTRKLHRWLTAPSGKAHRP
ncbi:MAG: antibiotic biosynthesis monooxygenase [Glaciihabitans sp.]|nr:antibiotic biosynthesis monooxygenase [Glaciihabitans sp.]